MVFKYVVKTMTLADHLFFPTLFTGGAPGKCLLGIPLTELEMEGGKRVLLAFFHEHGIFVAYCY